MCLSLPSTASAQTSPDRRAEAERLANSGAYAEALRAFQAIAAANPDDIDARMWIARMHTKLGHPEHAAEVYRSVLVAQPRNVDALVGLGNALVATGDLKGASDALSRAEAIAADSPAVLTAQGHLHEAANRTTLALAYYLRAAALDPSNTEARRAADALRALRGHRLELGYDFQHAPHDAEAFADPLREDAHVGTIELNGRLSDQVRLFGRAQFQRAFDSDEQRAGGGIEWTATPHAFVRAGFVKGFDTQFLPDTDGFVNAAISQGRARWGFDVQGASFDEGTGDNATLWLFGPDLTVLIGRTGEASIRYYHGRLTTPFSSAALGTDTVAVGIQGHVTSRARAGFSYTHGIDRLDWLTVDRIAFESDTVSFRVGFDATPFVSIEGGYDFQQRPADVNVHRARVALVYRF